MYDFEMMKMFSISTWFFICLFLSGCIAPEIRSATDEKVIINYDRTYSSITHVRVMAKNHCAGYGRVARYREDLDTNMPYESRVYSCVAVE